MPGNIDNSSSSQANIILLFVTILAAIGWLFSKHVIAAVTPMLFLTIRFFTASAMLSGVRPALFKNMPATWIYRSLFTGSFLGVQTALWGYALLHAQGMSAGAFLISLSYLLIPVTGLLFGYRAKKITWIAIAIALPGLALLALRNGAAIVPSDIVFLLSAVLYALYFNINGRLCADIPALVQTSLQLIAAGTITGIAYLLMEWNAEQDIQAVWDYLILSIVLATSLRFYLLLKAQSMAPEGQGALVMTLEPVWVALLGAWALNEELNNLALSGMALIFAALMINAVGSFRKKR